MQELILKLKTWLQQANSRTLLNIGLVGFILILVLLVIAEPGKKEAQKTVFLTDLKQSDIDEIELRRSNGGNLKLHRKDDIWFLTEPFQLPANDYRAQSVSALAELKSQLQYEITEADLKKFKLDKPEVTIVLNNDVTLEIGGVDPINNRRYVKNGNTLHLVTDNFYYQIIGMVTAYISYQLIPPNTEITQVVLPGLALKLEDDKWILSPEQKDVSADRINELIDEWRHAQSLEIAEYKGSPRKTNIQIHYKSQVSPIEFGIMKKDESTYLVRKDLKLSYKLSDETADKLMKLPDPVAPDEKEETQPAAESEKPAE